MMRVIARDAQPVSGFISGRLKATDLPEAALLWYMESLIVMLHRGKMILPPVF
jgi:hypothetical protein